MDVQRECLTSNTISGRQLTSLFIVSDDFANNAVEFALPPNGEAVTRADGDSV
jgi:hypothetical protein